MTRPAWVGFGLVVILLPLLPIPAWTGAFDQGPPWEIYRKSWTVGILTVLTLALLIGWLLRGWAGRALAPVPRWNLKPVLFLGLAFAAVAAATMHIVFAGNPHLVDEMAQLFHARVLASGRLAAEPPEPAQFFLLTHTFIGEAGWVSQYPPGHTVLLAAGTLIGLEWLVNPVLGGLGVVLVYLTARRLYGVGTATVAAILWVLSAWVLFYSATYLNHVGAAILGLAALALLVAPRRPGIRHCLGAGFLLAAVAATRPLDAVAASVPILVWLGYRRRWTAPAWMVLGGLPVMVAWGFFNLKIYGHPLELGYTALYGPEHNMGFHVDPYGLEFTPAVALSNLTVALRRLHVYLYEWPIPALLPLAAWSLFGRHRKRADLVLLAGLVAYPAGYFFYWHSGYFMGPRFYFGMVPFLVIGTARAWIWLVAWGRTRRWSGVRLDWALITASLVILVWGGLGAFPQRWEAYRQGFPTLKLDPRQEMKERGVSQALVLIPESFGSRIITGFWALGVPPGLVEQVYRQLDTCRLYSILYGAWAADLSGPEVTSILEGLKAQQSVPVPLVRDSPDPTLRIDPGRDLEERCLRELRRDYSGFTLFGSVGWRNPLGLDRGLVFARDLFELNERLFRQYPGWELWRYTPPRPRSRPELTRLGTIPQ